MCKLRIKIEQMANWKRKGIEKVKSQIRPNSTMRIVAISANAILAIMISILLRNMPYVDGDLPMNSFWTILAIILVILYIYINLQIFFSDSSDKIEFLDKIQYQDEISLQENFKQSLLQGLEELSEQTCQTVECSIICNEEKLKERLTKITLPLRNSLSMILDSNLCIGVYIENFQVFETVEEGLKNKNRIFILHDNIGLSEDIPPELMDIRIKDAKFFNKYLYSQISESTHDKREYSYQTIIEEDKRPKNIKRYFSALFRYIKVFCTNRLSLSEGTLFVIVDKQDKYDGNIESFISLYSWIILKFIRDHISPIAESNASIGRSNPFEMISFKEMSKRKKDKTYYKLGQIAEEKDWKYWVIRHKKRSIKYEEEPN